MFPQHPTSHLSFAVTLPLLTIPQTILISLDKDVDGEMLSILDHLLNLSESSECRSQGIRKQVNESFQNSYTTSESRSTGYFCLVTIFNLIHRVLKDAEIKVLKK